MPGSTALNNFRHAYLAFQEKLDENHPSVNIMEENGQACKRSFLEWFRVWQVADKQQVDGEEAAPVAYTYEVKQRNLAGPGRGKKCAIGVSFAFELLDIFVGQFAACTFPGATEAALIHPAPETVPENCKHLSRVLSNFYKNDPYQLLADIMPDLALRGLGENRVKTFKERILSCAVLFECSTARAGRPSRMERAAHLCAPATHLVARARRSPGRRASWHRSGRCQQHPLCKPLAASVRWPRHWEDRNHSGGCDQRSFGRLQSFAPGTNWVAGDIAPRKNPPGLGHHHGNGTFLFQDHQRQG